MGYGWGTVDVCTSDLQTHKDLSNCAKPPQHEGLSPCLHIARKHLCRVRV